MIEYNRVIIIPEDTFCSVDGVGVSGVDMAIVPNTIHAVQWYGTWGEQEIQDLTTGKIIHNEEVYSLDAYQAVLASYWEIRNAQEQLAAAEQATETVLEV